MIDIDKELTKLSHEYIDTVKTMIKCRGLEHLVKHVAEDRIYGDPCLSWPGMLAQAREMEEKFGAGKIIGNYPAPLSVAVQFEFADGTRATLFCCDTAAAEKALKELDGK